MTLSVLPRVRWRTTWHKLWPPRVSRLVFLLLFATLGALFLLGDYFFFHRIFENLLDNPDIPKILLVAVAAKLMGLVLLTTFTLLLFSAAVSALSYLYLDEDLSLLLALPIRRGYLRGYRSVEAGLNAGYMVALLLVPVVAAYWGLHPEDPWTLVLSLAGLALYLAIPLAWGICITAVLARFFPARKLHQILTVMTVVMLCLLVILFRLARPEALMNPTSSTQVLDVLRSIHLPSESLLPSTWLADVVVRGGEGLWPQAMAAMARLAALGGASLIGLVVLLRLLHWKGYTRSQEQANMKRGGSRFRPGAWALGGLVAAAPAGRKSRALLKRDALLFFRDPTQWGQLIILGALVVIYLFNVRYMPTQLAIFRVAVAYWNLATLGLIVASVAGRFAFTAVGSEGKAYFASRVLPIDVWSYLWAKYLFTAVPLTLLASLTLYGSNRFLGVSGDALTYTVFLAVASSLALAALALCMGSIAPVFDARNPAKAVMSAWGLTYMFLSLIYVGVVIVLSAKPVYHYYAHLLGRGPGADYGMASLDIGGLSLLIILTSFLAAAWRLKRLQPA